MKMSNNTPFLIETIDNMGAVYTFSTSSDEASTNFLKHALFVPTILRITELSQKQNKLAYTIGLDNAVKSTINMKIPGWSCGDSENVIGPYQDLSRIFSRD